MTNNQIVALFENSQLGVGELAEVFGMEEESIRVALVQGSSKYREQLKKDPSTFSEGDYEAARMTMVQLLTAEEAGVKFRAAKFVINEKKGRHDTKNIQQLNINVNLFNEKYKKAKEAAARATGTAIDIESETKLLNE